MAFRLPRLPATPPSHSQLQVWWQRVVERIEAQEAKQDELISEITAAVNRIRRLMSHTLPTTILSAVDNGPSCTITVLDHTRVYGDATTLAITGSGQAGLASGTWFACYYDDATLENTAPAFVFTTNLESAQAAVADGRHFCGLIKTPVAASGATIESGGAYPAGAATVGGELLQ